MISSSLVFVKLNVTFGVGNVLEGKELFVGVTVGKEGLVEGLAANVHGNRGVGDLAESGIVKTVLGVVAWVIRRFKSVT